jgi:hypothetical protein
MKAIVDLVVEIKRCKLTLVVNLELENIARKKDFLRVVLNDMILLFRVVVFDCSSDSSSNNNGNNLCE